MMINLTIASEMTQASWSVNAFGYPIATHGGKLVYAHRFAFRLYEGREITAGMDIDHLFQDKLDCRHSSLGEKTRSQNLKNVPARLDKTGTKFKGIFLTGYSDDFRIAIYYRGGTVNLGTYEDEILAACFYNVAFRMVEPSLPVPNDVDCADKTLFPAFERYADERLRAHGWQPGASASIPAIDDGCNFRKPPRELKREYPGIRSFGRSLLVQTTFQAKKLNLTFRDLPSALVARNRVNSYLRGNSTEMIDSPCLDEFPLSNVASIRAAVVTFLKKEGFAIDCSLPGSWNLRFPLPPLEGDGSLAIPLSGRQSQGRFTTILPAEWELVAGKSCFYSGGYVYISFSAKEGGARLLHRYLWISRNGPVPDGYSVDHRFQNTLDNRLDHLALKTPSEQARNRRESVNRKVPFTGLSEAGILGDAWRAQCALHGHAYHLGCYKESSHAGFAYNVGSVVLDPVVRRINNNLPHIDYAAKDRIISKVLDLLADQGVRDLPSLQNFKIAFPDLLFDSVQ